MQKGYTMDQAIAEASRCLLCHDAPCSTGCPAGTQPDRFIRKLRFSNLKGAVSVVKENNILGGVCGAICPAYSLCEQECLMSGIGEPIKISEIQRFLVEYGWQIGFRPAPSKPATGPRVAVVGAGPSGLTCAVELAKEGYKAVVYDRLPNAGGMLRHVIPDHRLSKQFVDREVADVEAVGVQFRCNAPIETQEDLDRLFAEGFEAVFLGTGAWSCAGLDVPQGGATHVWDAISFLRLAKRDVGAFGDLVRDSRVAVIGGGDTAIDAAVTARRHGARSASLVYRRSLNEMPGSLEEKVAAMRDGVHFLILTQPTDYVLDGRGVRGVQVVRTALGDVDESLRQEPVAVEGSQHIVQAELIVEALGLVPGDSVRRFSHLTMDRDGRIVVRDDAGRTSLERVFAGGDAIRGGSIVARAVADGKKAAAAIAEELGGASAVSVREGR
jgi:glutamate synthase (NADPH/NADH) small chain